MNNGASVLLAGNIYCFFVFVFLTTKKTTSFTTLYTVYTRYCKIKFSCLLNPKSRAKGKKKRGCVSETCDWI